MRQCVVCDHPDRAKIEKLLTEGETDRDVAAIAGITHSAVYRHHKNHMEHIARPRINVKDRLVKNKPPRDTPLVVRLDEPLEIKTDEPLGPPETPIETIETPAQIPIETQDRPEAPNETPVPVESSRLNAYEDLILLKAKAKAMIEETEDGTIFERVTAMKELRETVKALVSVYETQKRLESEYAPKLAQNQTFVYKWLYGHYPQVLAELTEAIRNG